jgi:hypothetical protein
LDSQPTIQSYEQPLNDSPDPLGIIRAGPADKFLFAFLLVDWRDGCCAHVELTFCLSASLGEQNGDLSDFGHTDPFNSFWHIELQSDQSRCGGHCDLCKLEFKEIEMTAATQTVREIALEQPTAIRVFEQFGIDYCCGGRKPLAEACAAGNLEIDSVIAALEEAEKKPGVEVENWAERT